MSAAAPVEVRHLIGGEWTGSAEAERRNPARPDEVVAQLAVGGTDDVEAALAAASAAFPGWRKTSPPARGAILARAAELMAARGAEIAEHFAPRRARPWPRQRAR